MLDDQMKCLAFTFAQVFIAPNLDPGVRQPQQYVGPPNSRPDGAQIALFSTNWVYFKAFFTWPGG
jgi:hypothetical protein